ncbi:MAG: methyltransferase domain-containing protein [Pseudonocardia sp.]
MTDPAPTDPDVVDRYSALARQALSGGRPTDCDADVFTGGCFGAAAYPDPDAPEAAVRASLGCGNPVAVADLRPGETVLDLGAGGGLDVLLSACRVRPGGRVIGVDASPDMVRLARANAAESGAADVEFRLGRIEDLPLPDAAVDVVISNCVLNLSLDKPRALAEAFRVLRPGGRLGISDVLADEGLDPARRDRGARRVGCVNGVLTAAEYRDMLGDAGFADVRIVPTSDAGGGMRSAIVRAARPAAPSPA